MRQNLKSTLMLVAILLGALLSEPISYIDGVAGGSLTPMLLFAMLFVTFCCIRLKDLKFSLSHIWLLLFQVIVGVATYYAIQPFNSIVAQGAMICIVTPVAMAAVALGAMLGANIASIATYSIVSNVAMSLFIPLFFNHIGSSGCTFGQILSRVAPIMVAPPIAAELVRAVAPRVNRWFASHGVISFYLWVVSLTITVARTTTYIKSNIADMEIFTVVALSLIALILCLAQYRIGRKIGARFDDGAAGEQSLGQKNTILAIWLTQSYLMPVASIAPTSYVIWQNIVNSYKLYRHNRSKKAS